MKHLQLFENFDDIDAICRKYGIINYTINPDGTVDVSETVSLPGIYITKLPIKFGRVTGNFDCSYNKLTSLVGCPKEITGYFDCKYNQLTSLEGAPKEVGGDFDCKYNQLTSLEGGPKEVGGDFSCRNNNLITLDGLPKELGGSLSCSGNPISQIYYLFGSYEEYQDSLDYGYLRGTDIVKLRFKEALEEIGKKVPDKIWGYNYI